MKEHKLSPMKFNRDKFVSLVEYIKINNFIKDSVFLNTLSFIMTTLSLGGEKEELAAQMECA